jgi:hypothetical protein
MLFRFAVHAEMNAIHGTSSGVLDRVADGEDYCIRHGHQSPRGRKMNISYKNFDFLRSTNFKLLSPIQRNSKNNCQFFRVYNFCTCDRSLRAPKNVATPLILDFLLMMLGLKKQPF